MKNSFFLMTAILIILSVIIPHHTYSQDSTFAIKLNGHKYNQEEDLMLRTIEEWFDGIINDLDLPTLIDTLASANGLVINELKVPEFVTVLYEVDESGTNDFLSDIIMDTLYISATGLGCEFEVNIIGAGFVLGGVSTYENGKLNLEVGTPDTLKPEISVVGTGHALCPALAELFKAELETEIDSLLIDLALNFDPESFNNLLSFLNPIQALGIEDSVLIEQALQSFPMEMGFYTEYDPVQEIVQLITEINFLMGTANNQSAFIGIEPAVIHESQLESGGFSFLYWVLQKSFPWHTDWTESQRVSEALRITGGFGFKDIRLELRWSELQKLAYRGNELDPADLTPEDIDGLLTDPEHWDTTAFTNLQNHLDNGFTFGLIPFLALGVGHEDRMPLDEGGLRIAPATEGWQSPEGYTGISAGEYLYNLKIYAHAVVRTFAQEIKVWQIENELNAAGFASAVPDWWRKGDLWNDPEFRNQVWDILVEAVRTEDPDPSTRIIHDLHMLGFMEGLEDWIKDLDIVGINYYPNQVSSLPVMGFTVGEYVWAVRRALKGLGHEEIPVWLTETGYPGIEIVDPPEDILLANDIAYFSESKQEEYVLTALKSAVENGVNGFFYYSLVTQDDFPGGIPQPMRYSGMIRRDTDAYKPALQTYSDLYKSLLAEPAGIDDVSDFLPQHVSLYQNYPNPFNPATVINYQLPASVPVELIIYNLQGRKVATLVSEKQNAGHHWVEWNASGFASGIYFYQLKAENFLDIKKMILIK